jgi:hypothetical protein
MIWKKYLQDWTDSPKDFTDEVVATLGGTMSQQKHVVVIIGAGGSPKDLASILILFGWFLLIFHLIRDWFLA